MSKELPYFRFTAHEWLTDDISFESFELKGLFVDVCSFYWTRDCAVTKELLNKRFKSAIALLKELFDASVITMDEQDIMDATMNRLSELSKMEEEP